MLGGGPSPDAAEYVVGELNGGAAHIPASPDITGVGGAVVPFGTISLGMGF